MKSIVLYCNWGVYIDSYGNCYMASIHCRYIEGLNRIGYSDITLISKLSGTRSRDMDALVNGVNVIKLPWFSSYLGSVKSIIPIIQCFWRISSLKVNKIYLRTYEPFTWLLGGLYLLKGKVRKENIIFHFISDPKSAIFSNAMESNIKKIIRYALFLPEYYLTSFVASLCKATSNGPVPKKNTPWYLSRKMKVVIESALSLSDLPERPVNKSSTKLNILYVGYLRASKGVDVIIDAAIRLKNDGYTNFLITLVGNGEYKEHLNNKAQKYGLCELITFKGYIPFSNNLFNIYSKSDVFINPSPSETGPRVLIEASFFSNYLVSTDVGYSAQIVNESQGGTIFNIDDSKELSKILKELINKKNKNLPLLSSFKSSGKNYTIEGFFREVLNEA